MNQHAITAKNFIFFDLLIKLTLLQVDAEIPNYGVTHAIMSTALTRPSFAMRFTAPWRRIMTSPKIFESKQQRLWRHDETAGLHRQP
jgi:hypothetical protein